MYRSAIWVQHEDELLIDYNSTFVKTMSAAQEVKTNGDSGPSGSSGPTIRNKQVPVPKEFLDYLLDRGITPVHVEHLHPGDAEAGGIGEQEDLPFAKRKQAKKVVVRPAKSSKKSRKGKK